MKQEFIHKRYWQAGRLQVVLLLVPALLVGILVRAVPVFVADFPLNDGGLFYTMVRDIRSDGGLPITTSYNDAQIPFAYPPLALFLTAALATLGLDELRLLQWIPLLASVATIPLVYLLVRELEGSWRIAAGAALVYALIPRSYVWLITGGGITRAVGFAIALTAVWQGARLISAPSPMRVLLTGSLGGLALMTHPEAALFVAISLTVFWLSFGRSWANLMRVAAAGVVGLVVSAPWWMTVLSRHGIAVLLGAADSRTASVPLAVRQLIFGEFTGAALLDIFLGLGLIGLLIQLARGRWMLPVWLCAVAVGIAAAGFTFAAAPWAVLVAIAITQVILPMVNRLAFVHRLGTAVVALGLIGAGVLSSFGVAYSPAPPTSALSSDQVEAMEWVSENSPADARFLVVTGVRWQADAVSEWFPAIAKRHSVATVQGYEWVPGFQDRVMRHGVLQGHCARRLAECLRAWIDAFDTEVDYVFVPKGRIGGLVDPDDCCPAIRDDLVRGAEVVFDRAGATVVRWKD